MNSQNGINTKVTRRDFIKATGTIVLVAGTGFHLSAVDEIPSSDGYLLVDVEKCQGCVSCMLACSLVHEGAESLSLSRIQIMQNSFESFPDDLTIEQCRQCVDPPCVKECPTSALEADARYGNVRMVDKEKCIGCGTCYDVCPYIPSRPVVVADEDYGGELKSRKCDLCANTPYHWDEAGGGPDGKQACVEVCPVGAIKFTKKIPTQKGDDGYKVNLRDKNWERLGYPHGGKAGTKAVPGGDVWLATRTGNIEAVRQHLARGVGADVRSADGTTLLAWAALLGQTEIAQLLIREGADINARNRDGSTPLHGAVFFGETETVELLIQKGADVNARNNQGATPLDTTAVDWGITEYVATLLQIKLDKEKVKTARTKIADILRQHGASDDK